MRSVFLVRPHSGGTFSVYANLRLALSRLGVTLEWMGFSDEPDKLRADAAFVSAMKEGHLIDARGKSEIDLLRELLSGIEQREYEMVFINVLTSVAEMSVAAYLPAHVRRAMIVHSITPGTFNGAKAVAPYVQAAVGVSPRIRDDLQRKLGLPEEMTFAAPNALDLSPYDHVVHPPKSQTLRVLYLGRINDVDKGVFWLPEILAQLPDVSVHFTIAGDGADLPALKKRSADVASRMTFLGRVAGVDVPQLMANHDALIMPSRFEGLPFTLIEAMAAGCVPVASIIRGSTDFVLQHGTTGLLFPVGDTVEAARSIRRLANDRTLLRAMSAAGMKDSRDRFSLAQMAANYGEVLKAVAKAPPFEPKRGEVELLKIGGGWRRFVPNVVKNFVKRRMYSK